ncbi:MAG TPA: GntR family transcriptional regulator [Ramlibacter sp.]|nr:GntR family transcriptional regulator [Ramlibacter sp.]
MESNAATERSNNTHIAAAYERLRADIVGAKLAPGSKLRIEALKRQYELGPSPLREALNRLAAEGWVEHREQRGFHVVGADQARYAELLKARIWADGSALRDSILHRDPAWEDRLVLALHHLLKVPRFVAADSYDENPEWERLHRAFHMTLLSNCTSSFITEFCAHLYDHAHRYRQLALTVNRGQRKESGEHKAIAEAALAGEANQAVDLLCAHYQRTASIIGVAPEDVETEVPQQVRAA